MTAYFLTGVRPIDGTVALQIPVRYQGLAIATPEFIARAHTTRHIARPGTPGTDACGR